MMRTKTFITITCFLLSCCLVVFIISCGEDSATNPEPESYSVFGKVIDSSGNSVQGVTVTVAGKSAVSDSTGSYTIQDLTDDSYTISYSKTGYTIEPSSKQFTLSGASLELATVNATLTTSTYSISGEIYDLDQNGASGVLVQLFNDDFTQSVFTDSTGAYSFSGIPAGSYTLTPFEKSRTFNPAYLQPVVSGENLFLPDMQVASLIFLISGRVVDADGNGVEGVEVYSSGGSKDQTTKTSQSGLYSFTDSYSIDSKNEPTYLIAFNKTGYIFSPLYVEVVVEIDDFTAEDVRVSEWHTSPPHDINGISFVNIPGGTFLMGDVEGGGDEYWEKPVHRVTISPFEMSTCEITNAQYATYLNSVIASIDIAVARDRSSVYGPTGEWGGNKKKVYLVLDHPHSMISFTGNTFVVDNGKEKNPVIEVTWYGAKAFAEYYGFDLPREAEWEYACRGGIQYEYGTDDGTIDRTKANYNRYYNINRTVGYYPPNPFGLYDMSGNVSEWCAETCGKYSQEHVIDSTIPPNVGGHYVARGGNWRSQAESCRSSHRSRLKPYGDMWNVAYIDVGFRVVRR